MVRENQKLFRKCCQLGEFGVAGCKPVWLGWEAPGTMVTIWIVLKGVPCGLTHGLICGGRPPQLLKINLGLPCGLIVNKYEVLKINFFFIRKKYEVLKS